MDTLSQQQQEIREKHTIKVRPPLESTRRINVISSSSCPALLLEPHRNLTDDDDTNNNNSTSYIVKFPSKSMSRSPRTKSLADLLSDEEKALPSTSLPLQDSFLNHFSTPSRISRSSTHQHLITPELDSEEYSSTFHLTAEFQEKKTKKSSRDLAKMIPSKRGVGNIMTITAVIAVIIFLFAGYPLTVYLTRKIHPSSSNQ